MYLPNHSQIRAILDNARIFMSGMLLQKAHSVKERTGMKGKELLLCQFYQAVIQYVCSEKQWYRDT